MRACFPILAEAVEHDVLIAAGRVLGMAELAHASANVSSNAQRAQVIALPDPTMEEARSDAQARSCLTTREREVLEYLALGYTNREIALACGNAPNTVKRQLASIFSKLDVCTRAEAVRVAMLEGYVVPRTARKVFG